MYHRYFALRAATAWVIVCGIAAGAHGDDCLRRLGFGYSAGYHAPPACPTPSCHQKLGVWHGWKQACTLPNARPLGGDCECAPCVSTMQCAPAMPCAPLMPSGCGCGPTLPLFQPGAGFRTFAPIGGCSTCPGGAGQPGRAALMFN